MGHQGMLPRYVLSLSACLVLWEMIVRGYWLGACPCLVMLFRLMGLACFCDGLQVFFSSREESRGASLSA